MEQFLRQATLIAGMFCVTACTVYVETSCVKSALMVGCIVSPLKYGWVAIHSMFWNRKKSR